MCISAKNIQLSNKLHKITAAKSKLKTCHSGVKMAKWKNIPILIPKAQSFISLMADVRQDMNGGFAFSRCLNGTFP